MFHFNYVEFSKLLIFEYSFIFANFELCEIIRGYT